ncbi:hypothetical protein KSD_16630 [Ktedonobacter sp. SOSP1-85]|nr:hypothetical protein KSD_16630 [Ktedonobacter sp. SOSP1-85]
MRDLDWRATSATHMLEPSSGKFAPTDTIAREENATLHISPHRHSAFSRHSVPSLGISNLDVIA